MNMQINNSNTAQRKKVAKQGLFLGTLLGINLGIILGLVIQRYFGLL